MSLTLKNKLNYYILLIFFSKFSFGTSINSVITTQNNPIKYNNKIENPFIQDGNRQDIKIYFEENFDTGKPLIIYHKVQFLSIYIIGIIFNIISVILMIFTLVWSMLINMKQIDETNEKNNIITFLFFFILIPIFSLLNLLILIPQRLPSLQIKNKYNIFYKQNKNSIKKNYDTFLGIVLVLMTYFCYIYWYTFINIKSIICLIYSIVYSIIYILSFYFLIKGDIYQLQNYMENMKKNETKSIEIPTKEGKIQVNLIPLKD